MKKYWFLFLLCGIKGYMQIQSKDSLKSKRFKVEYGITVPTGNLSSKIGISQQFSFWYSTKITHGEELDLGITVIVPKVKERFTYQGKDSLFKVKSRMIHVLLASRFNKQFPLQGKCNGSVLEWRTSYGISFFCFEDLENPENTSGSYTNPDGSITYKIDTNTKALTSLYVGQGFGLVFKRFGLHATYNFTPYSWFSKRIENNFGNSSLSVQLQYKLK